MKLKNLVKAVKTLETLQYEKTNINFSYKLMKILKTTKDDVDFYNKSAQAIIDKYALRDENGNYVYQNGSVSLDATKEQKIKKETDSLNEKDVEIPNIKLILNELKFFRLSAADLMNIEEFITEEE